MKFLAAFVLLVLLIGCSGRLYSIPLNPGFKDRVNGIIVYPPQCQMLVTETTSLVNGSQACVPVQSCEQVCNPDYSRPYAVGYDAALFETHALSLTISDKGVLTAINYNSTSPGKETLDVLNGTVGLIKEVTKGVPPAGQDCTNGKRIKGYISFYNGTAQYKEITVH